MLPLRDHVFIRDAAAAEIVAGGLLVRARLVRRRIVGQNQRVLAVLVLEVVIDSFFFHQPRNEIEVRLPILHAIIARDEIAVEPKFEILKSEVPENLLDDVGNFLVLKDPAIGRTCQEPEPRHHFRAISSEPPILRALREAADEAVPVALLPSAS